MTKIQFLQPSITKREIDAATSVMQTGWFGLGPQTAEFERQFADYIGGGVHAVAVNSGTAALHLALLVAGVGPGDEVLVPAITFVSTANAVRYCGAEPVFVDVDAGTLNIDVADAEHKVTDATKAIIPVHLGGHPCEMDEVRGLANFARYRKNAGTLLVIEDAAHACGAEYRGVKIGSLDTFAACFSFGAVKNLTCGEGGMIIVHDKATADRLRVLRRCGMDFSKRNDGDNWHGYEVNELGFRCAARDTGSAIGLVQLDRLPETNARRREIAEAYNEAFADLDWLETPVEHSASRYAEFNEAFEHLGWKFVPLKNPYARSSWHNYVIKTDRRDRLHHHLAEQGIETGVHYMPLHLHPYYRKRREVTLPVAEAVWPRLLTLPLHPDLTDGDVERVIEGVRGCV